MKKAIVIGATSGIGKALAERFLHKGYTVGITGRRTDRLTALKNTYGNFAVPCSMDITNTTPAMNALSSLISDMGGVDIIVINAGILRDNPLLLWEDDRDVIATNVTGFTAMTHVAFHHFLAQGHGHLVGISSVAGLRGGPACAYSASKAFMSNYLQGLRFHTFAAHKPIDITDIRPGFVATEMIDPEGLHWIASAEKAARQIDRAISAKKHHAYITKRWVFLAWLMQIMPEWLYQCIRRVRRRYRNDPSAKTIS